jgi:AraC family transcriptional regulator
MNTSAGTSLSVTIKDLPTRHVAYMDCKDQAERDDFNGVRGCFQHVQSWVKEAGYAPLLTLGAFEKVDDQLLSYDTCVQVPEEVTTGSDDIGIKELPGGRYAVVSIEKAPAVIGDSIRRFHQEYVPQNNLAIDDARPSYEIYYESTMEYCVPIL